MKHYFPSAQNTLQCFTCDIMQIYLLFTYSSLLKCFIGVYMYIVNWSVIDKKKTTKYVQKNTLFVTNIKEANSILSH